MFYPENFLRVLKKGKSERVQLEQLWKDWSDYVTYIGTLTEQQLEDNPASETIPDEENKYEPEDITLAWLKATNWYAKNGYLVCRHHDASCSTEEFIHKWYNVNESMDEHRLRHWERVKTKAFGLMLEGVTVTTSQGSKTFQTRKVDLDGIRSRIMLFDKKTPTPSTQKFYTLDNEQLDFTEADFIAIGIKIDDLVNDCITRKEAIRDLLWADTVLTKEDVDQVYTDNIDMGWPTVPFTG